VFERLVNWVRIVKSDAEIKLMKSAAQITESAMKTAFNSINPGVRQCDAVADIQKALFKGTPEFGGDYASIATLLPTGKGTSASHLTATEDKFVSGEATIIEIEGGKEAEPIVARILSMVTTEDGKNMIIATDNQKNIYNINDFSNSTSICV
jgi:hypothetical protein